jgi:hypothetical protein
VRKSARFVDRLGKVAVTEELIERLGGDVINAAIAQLRMSDNGCWKCGMPMRAEDDVSLVAQTTSVGGRVGFVHMRCAPPQLIDTRRSRRAALAFDRYFESASSDVPGFMIVRDYPAPHGLLVVSAESGIKARGEDGETLSPWLELLFSKGFVPVVPDVFDAAPEPSDGWVVEVQGETVRCGTQTMALFTGELTIPPQWREAVSREQQCMVLAVAVGVSSSAVGDETGAALNALASRGSVAVVGARASSGNRAIKQGRALGR